MNKIVEGQRKKYYTIANLESNLAYQDVMFVRENRNIEGYFDR